MNQRVGWLIALATAALVAIALYQYRVTDEPAPSPLEREARLNGSEEARTAFSPDNEIVYSRSVLVRPASFDRLHPASISIDEGPPQSVPCSDDRDARTSFGYVLLDVETKGQLECVDDYLGGLSLSYQSATGTTVSLSLAMNDGDAGDQWETRSRLTKSRSDTPKMTIEKISLSSEEDPMDRTLLGCSVTRTIYTWDHGARELVKSAAAPSLSPAEFAPPIGVASGCLDEDGNWKGQ